MHLQVLITLFLIIFTVAFPCFSESRELTIVTEDWPPYNYIEENEAKGFSVEIVRWLMKELNADYPIQVLPGVRAREVLDKGPRVMLFSMLRISDREKLYKWIGPLADDSIYFYKKKGSDLRIRTIEDVRNVKSVSCRHVGLVYTTLVKNRFTNLDVSSNPASIYLKVIAGRCDLAIGEPPLGVIYWLKKSAVPVDSLQQTTVKLMDAHLYIACSKDISDQEILLWQKALDRMKVSGEFHKVYHKYNN
jgi:polar amino acid transport system substrate-binding protein